MGDHQFQEHSVERRALGRGQRRHLFGGRHAGHAHMAAAMRRMIHALMSGMRVGNRLAPLGQPAAHELDLVGLGGGDAPANVANCLRVGPRLDQPDHVHGLLVVDDHVLHEPDIGLGIAGVGDLRGLLGGQGARRLAGRTGLDDGRILRRCDRGQCAQADDSRAMEHETCRGLTEITQRPRPLCRSVAYQGNIVDPAVKAFRRPSAGSHRARTD